MIEVNHEPSEGLGHKTNGSKVSVHINVGIKEGSSHKGLSLELLFFFGDRGQCTRGNSTKSEAFMHKGTMFILKIDRLVFNLVESTRKREREYSQRDLKLFGNRLDCRVEA